MRRVGRILVLVKIKARKITRDTIQQTNKHQTKEDRFWRNAFLMGQPKMGNSWERSFNETKVYQSYFLLKQKKLRETNKWSP